ncbi:hypothetical protein MHU86_25308 [Fragilaria crotonensis]|nr:hypothetical protein MHU86_25308 [Fragilaria crotonensis]
MMKPTLLNVAAIVSIILCIVLCVIETVLKIVEGGPPSEVGLIVVSYLLITTLAVIVIFGKLGPHPAKHDDITEWITSSMCLVFAIMLLVRSLISWDPFYLVVAIVCVLGIAVHSARQCGLIAKPLATPPTTPPFSRLSRDSRVNIWILLLWVVNLILVTWDSGRIWEPISFGMVAVSCGIVAFSPSIDYADVTDAETLGAQQDGSVASHYEGMPV